jgi:hypothetical protein
MMAPNTKHNSYWLQIDDACGINVGDSDTFTLNTWTWVAYKDGDATQTVTRDLAQGVHTVKLVGREPNVRIDRLVFAKGLSCVPVDTGANCATGATTPPDPVISALGTIADTYVASDTPRRNFGTQATFFVDNSPTKVNTWNLICLR